MVDAFNIMLGEYSRLLKSYAHTMAKTPSYFQLDDNWNRTSKFIPMPAHLKKDFANRANTDECQKAFTLHQIFNYMTYHHRDITAPLYKHFDEDRMTERQRDARRDGLRYATQYWMAMLTKVFQLESATAVGRDFNLPELVDEIDISFDVMNPAARVMAQWKPRIEGLVFDKPEKPVMNRAVPPFHHLKK